MEKTGVFVFIVRATVRLIADSTFSFSKTGEINKKDQIIKILSNDISMQKLNSNSQHFQVFEVQETDRKVKTQKYC